jgi:hypothetical protein
MATKSSESLERSENFSPNASNAISENPQFAEARMSKGLGQAKDAALAVDALPALTIGDDVQKPHVDNAVSIWQAQGPRAAVREMMKDLSTFERDEIAKYERVAGFDRETSQQLARENSQKRYEEMKEGLIARDPKAAAKMQLAYLDNVLNDMDAAGGRYGRLDDYGLRPRAYFENQSVNGSSPMAREMAQIAVGDFSKIADPKNPVSDSDPSTINKREWTSYKNSQIAEWSGK